MQLGGEKEMKWSRVKGRGRLGRDQKDNTDT